MRRLARMLFRRSTPPQAPAPEREACYRAKLRAIRERGKSDPPMRPEDVTGVIDLALKQLGGAMKAGQDEERRAADALRHGGDSIGAACSLCPDEAST